MPSIFDFETPRIIGDRKANLLCPPDSFSDAAQTIFQKRKVAPKLSQAGKQMSAMDLNTRIRIKEIRKHIKRQNNSLFMRIHYQDMLPSYQKSLNFVDSVMCSSVDKLDKMKTTKM
jgi:hypothetical protein